MASQKPPVTDGAAAATNKEFEEDPEETQLLARLDELQVKKPPFKNSAEHNA